MFQKSISSPNLTSISVGKSRMIKSNSHTNIDITDTTNTLKWSIHDIEHVAPFVPIKNIAKCMVTHTFPISLISDSDDSSIDMGLCMVDPEYAEGELKLKCQKLDDTEINLKDENKFKRREKKI